MKMNAFTREVFAERFGLKNSEDQSFASTLHYLVCEGIVEIQQSGFRGDSMHHHKLIVVKDWIAFYLYLKTYKQVTPAIFESKRQAKIHIRHKKSKRRIIDLFDEQELPRKKCNIEGKCRWKTGRLWCKRRSTKICEKNIHYFIKIDAPKGRHHSEFANPPISPSVKGPTSIISNDRINKHGKRKRPNTDDKQLNEAFVLWKPCIHWTF